MASTIPSQIVIDALTAVFQLLASAQGDIQRAQTDVDAAKALYEAAEARRDEVVQVRRRDLEILTTQRKKLAKALQDQSDLTNEDVQSLLQPQGLLALYPSTSKLDVPAKMSTWASETPDSPAYAAEPKPTPMPTPMPTTGKELRQPVKQIRDGFTIIAGVYANDPGYLEACTILIPGDTRNQWIELRCQQCDTNCDGSRGNFLKGASGIQKHFARKHGTKVDVAAAIQQARYRNWTRAEVEKIVSGGTKVQAISKHNVKRTHKSIPDAAAASSPAFPVSAVTASITTSTYTIELPAAAAESSSPIASTRSEKEDETEETETEIMEEEATGKKRKTSKKEALTPNKKQRLENFRAQNDFSTYLE